MKQLSGSKDALFSTISFTAITLELVILFSVWSDDRTLVDHHHFTVIEAALPLGTLRALEMVL